MKSKDIQNSTKTEQSRLSYISIEKFNCFLLFCNFVWDQIDFLREYKWREQESFSVLTYSCRFCSKRSCLFYSYLVQLPIIQYIEPFSLTNHTYITVRVMQTVVGRQTISFAYWELAFELEILSAQL